jgi:hypothetical protein
VGERGDIGGGTLRLDIARWKAVRDGSPVVKPVELETAEMIDNLCQRYGCPPSVILRENVGILKMLHIVSEGKVEDDGERNNNSS